VWVLRFVENDFVGDIGEQDNVAGRLAVGKKKRRENREMGKEMEISYLVRNNG